MRKISKAPREKRTHYMQRNNDKNDSNCTNEKTSFKY